MITPKELFQKSDKQFFKIVKAILNGEEVFPLLIPANKSISGTNFSELKAAIVPLYQQSKEVKGKGYSVEWTQKTVDGTKQKLPTKIYFETLNDYLFFTNGIADYSAIEKAFQLLTESFPALMQWAKDNTPFLLNQADNSGYVRALDWLPGSPDVCFFKHTHNAFSDTGLDLWLRRRGIERLIIAGIRTEQCCETTTRVGSDIGYEVDFVSEATLTFPMTHPVSGRSYLPAEIKEHAELVLAGRLARIVSVHDCLAALGEGPA